MRKVLSFVLVLTLVLSSFSMAFATAPATAAGLSDIAGNANEEAIQVSYDLGIVTGNPDGTFLPAKAVTRAEFAAMITRALAIPDSALAGYTATTFKDTTGYGWAVPYLAFCNSKGIMLGDGAGNAMPGRTINTNEAVTMVLRAIGYTSNSSELVGAWPSNYVTLAQNKGLYDSVAATGDVDKASAAQVIYNALTVQKVAVNSDGATNFLDNGKASDDANYKAYNLLNTGLKCDENVDQTIDGSDDAVINLQKYIGQFGTTYTNSDNEIVAFVADSTQLIGTFDGGFDQAFTTLDSVDYTNNADGADLELANGAIDDPGYVADTIYVVNADVSGKKINQIYSVAVWTSSADAVVAASDLESIKDDQSLLGANFTLDDNDNIDNNSFYLVGVASLDDIKADDVVYVYAGGTDNEITRVEVGTKQVEGLVKSVKSDDITIGSTVYANASIKNNALVGDNTDVTTDDVSKNVKAYLDVNGYIYSRDVTDDVASNVAVELKGNDGIDYQVKLINADGTEKVYTVKSSVVADLPGEDNLLTYGLNKDGKISSAATDDTLVPLTVDSEFKSNSVVAVDGGATYSIDSDVAVFAKNGAADYDLSSIDDVTKDPITVAGQLLLDDSDKVIGIIVDAADANAAANDVYGVINSEYADTDANGDKVMRLEGFADGVALDKFTDSDATVLADPFNENDFTTLGGVQIYKLDINADGVITAGDSASGDLTTDVENATVQAVDGRKAIQDSTDEWYALATDVVFYEYVPADGEYKVYTGKLQPGWNFSVFDTDSDTAGAEIVVFIR